MSELFNQVIHSLLNRKDLSFDDSKKVMTEIMSGVWLPTQIASFLTALRMKSETAIEIAGMASVMREKSKSVQVDQQYLVDTCGTGGDGAHTFNISTTAAFIASGAGAIIAKHGNRSISSRCGSADLLEKLGVNLSIDSQGVQECINKIGIGFLFAPLWHPAMKYAATPRKELGIRTIFNLLGPLSNPAHAKNQLVGVFDLENAEKIAHSFLNLEHRHIFVVHGLDGLDEITLTQVSKIFEVKNQNLNAWLFDPVKFGFNLCSKEDILGGDLECNYQITKNILLNKDHSPRRDIVIINAAFAVLASGITHDLNDALHLCVQSLENQKALEKLELLIQMTLALS